MEHACLSFCVLSQSDNSLPRSPHHSPLINPAATTSLLFSCILVCFRDSITIMQELGPCNELVLCSVLADGVTPEAVLGVCPVDVQPESKLATPSRQCCHYWCTSSTLGAIDDWGKLLFDSIVKQYGHMCKFPPQQSLHDLSLSCLLDWTHLYCNRTCTMYSNFMYCIMTNHDITQYNINLRNL